MIEELTNRYQGALDAQDAVDFDDLLLRGVELMECSEAARRFAARRFQHVLVDEYQDTNRIQYRLLRLLAPHGNVFVVGDDDQAIYNFRGADVRHILDFDKDFPGARVITLERNYRSTGAILRAASAVIANNEARKAKRLVAHLDDGERPELFTAGDERDEAAFVARRIAEARAREPGLQCAILMRTHAQTRVFEEELTARKVPYRVVGGLRFYERREVRDVLAYLRLALNPGDDAAFRRVVNVPPRGIGQATLARLEGLAEDARCALWEASAAALENDLLPARPRSGLAQFRDLVSALSQKAASVPPSGLMRFLIDKSGLNEELEREGAAAARERRENIDQLIAAAAELESREGAPLASFLDGISLLSDTDSLGGSVPCVLMTLHAAKGLEFDVVFLPGLEEGLFPHIRSTGNRRSLEEERRLFYVGMTRARRKLHLSWARSRRFAVQASSRAPSRFLAEIPPELVEARGATRSEPSMAPSKERPHRSSGSSGLRPGAVVVHEKFGEGKVLDASGSGADRRLTVLFWKAGRKRLVARYAKLQLVDG